MADWGRIRLVWEGWDGSRWEISDPQERLVNGVPVIESGVFIPREGVRGMNMPPIQRYKSESAMVAGSRYRGSRTQEREVFWPVMISTDVSSSVMREREDAWWKTMHPAKPGRWWVYAPDGTYRSLSLRFDGDGDGAFDSDPLYFGRAVYGITLVAEQPYWEGPDVTRRWGLVTTAGMFAGPGIINISAGQALDNATIPNPGDVAAWPVWTIVGGFTSATVGVDGKLIEVPFALTADRKLVIDTRPDRLTAYEYAATDADLSGSYIDRTDDIGAAVFGAVPDGTAVPLTITVNGADTNAYATATLTPLYFRAW